MEKFIYFQAVYMFVLKVLASKIKASFVGKALLLSPKSVCVLSPLVTLTSTASGPAAAMEGQMSGWSSTVTVTPISCAIRGAFTRLTSELAISFSSPTRTAEPRNVFILDTPGPAQRIGRVISFAPFLEVICKSYWTIRLVITRDYTYWRLD